MPRLTPVILGGLYQNIEFSVEGPGKEIYLTFDDGPSNRTSEILDVLERHQVEATFFITGSRVKGISELENIQDMGHQLGNHMYTTDPSSELNLQEFKQSINKCQKLIGDTRLFRFSSDFGNLDQQSIAKENGYRIYAGTVFPLDHWITNPEILYRLSLWLAIDDGILILHDGNDRATTTANVLDRIIPALKNKGYVFKTLPGST